MTQADEVLAYLKEHGSLTSLEAVKALGCTRLAARVLDLEKRGISIPRETIAVQNRKGKTIHVTRYFPPRPKGQGCLFPGLEAAPLEEPDAH